VLDVDVPSPNPFISAWLIGPQARAMVFEAAELYQALYIEVVAKRTGRLAASARISTGIQRDRWAGYLEVHAPYAASHEYGTGRKDPSRALPAAHDLNHILDLMGTL
jgi:hypothetical protein